MPFTPTHVAAILPVAALARGRLPFAALVIGSMIPDLPLFVGSTSFYDVTHSVPGLFTACLPLGIIGFLTFHHLLKQPLFALLPVSIQSHCASLARPRAGETIASIVAIVIGATTHVLWDSFTHQGRWGTRLIPSLGGTALTVAGRAVPGYKLAQYGSTLILLPVMAVFLALWLSHRPLEPLDEYCLSSLSVRAKASAYLVVCAIPSVVTVLVFVSSNATPYERLGRALTTSGLALMSLILICSAVYQFAIGKAARDGG
jgi:Domain of unknown function (DUF4184)